MFGELIGYTPGGTNLTLSQARTHAAWGDFLYVHKEITKSADMCYNNRNAIACLGENAFWFIG